MTDHLPDVAKVFGVSTAGLTLANFSGLDAALNTGILAITFLYGAAKLFAAVRDLINGRKLKDDETKRD